ncbi:MBL fold metallo-hydrolase [Aestuariibius insulae]|uniref:MBL fold metallo-hydrolase n=1 Tax=Aestuariibius insulae TaxID=2058287 RepID=UPI00345EF35D
MRYFIFCLIVLAAGASAQERRPSHCIAMVGGPETVMRAGFRDPVADDTIRITYVDHAMFLLQTPGGLSAATDFTGFMGAVEFVPDVVTMNKAHSSHWTALPDPAIPHVLWGWEPDGTAEHHLDLGEMLVRNVPTDIRSRDGGAAAEPDGNSIFIFEAGGLCIGHLGHLHHEPTAADYAAIGRLDVVMAPVDGGLTLDLETMIRVLKRFRASVVIPMHWFGPGNLERFLDGMEDEFAIERMDGNEMVVSLRELPNRPTVRVLQPGWLTEE